MLAYKLKQNEAKCSVNARRNNEGDTVTEPKQINQVFYDFYKLIHDNAVDLHKCKTFLNSITKIEIGRNRFFWRTVKDLKISVKSLQKGKSGSDGIPPELYLALWDTVGALILDSINYALEHKTFHRD